MFKLVCGAGIEDEESVKRLVYVYAKAGCKLFDISARKEILLAAKEGAVLSGMSGVKYCVSVGIKGDPHILKAYIDKNKCTNCGECYKICPNEAIDNHLKCIGCSKCEKICPVKAITMKEKDVDISSVLPYMIQNGVDIIELHVNGHDREDLKIKWKIINDCRPKYASICIDRETYSNTECLALIREMISVRDPFTTIVQADGIPMSGSDDTFKTTLQAVAMAEIIQNSGLPVYIMLSGGTNSKTAILAKQCGINYWGIAIGSWARKIIKEYVNTPDFWENLHIQQLAIEKARDLITASV